MSSQRFSGFKFEIIHRSTKSSARAGRIHTPHGIIDTPGFVPVGTNAAIKGVSSLEVETTGTQLVFYNTYHLVVRPGLSVIEAAGGIHKFSARRGPIITDSGGFQVFSLKYGGVAQELKSQGQKVSKNLVIKINEEGVAFRSYVDGSKILLTPESSIDAQKIIGADIIVAFDELLPYHIDRVYQLKSLHRTHRWEERSLIHHNKNEHGQAIYAVVHGGIDEELRSQSCSFLSNLPFDGMAVGGSVGKNLSEMTEMLKNLMPQMPPERPVHLLGIGDLPSILACTPLGIDTFDSAYPTRAARHGLLLAFNGNLKLARTSCMENFGPIEADCPCYTCQNYTVSYLGHLFKAKELSYYSLATVHNLTFMAKFMASLREKIMKNEI